MRKLVLAAAVAAFALGTSPASADVFVNAQIDKDKDKRVVELIAKVKLVAILVVVLATPDKFAESEALFNQRNERNEACENCAEKRDKIIDSINRNTGLVSVNQAAGNMNNQGTAIAFSFDAASPPPTDPGPNPDPGNGKTGFAEAQASGTQYNQTNKVDSVNILFRDALIRDSINGNTGLVYVNQAAGNLNNQANALSVAVSLAAGVALSEADLGQFNTGNNVVEHDVFKTAVIANSVNRNTGIVGVNQTSGNMANQTNMVSIAATF